MTWPQQRNRLLMICAAVCCALLFWWGGALLHIPLRAGYGGSLLTQPNPVLSILATLVLLMVGVLLATAVAGTAHAEAGLYGAAIGLLALSMRNGVMGDVLRGGTGSAIFLLLAAELVVLGGFLLAGVVLLNLLRDNGWLRDEGELDGLRDLDASPSSCIQAAAAHAVVTALVTGALARSDDKAQVVAAVLLGAYAASLAAHSLFPINQGAWLLCGPIAAGLFGYLLTAMSGAAVDWRIGLVGDHFGASLARPLPLDWAGAGTAGALAGYWTSRKWIRARQVTAASQTS